MKVNIPQLITNNENINKAFRIAISDIIASIATHKDGLLEQQKEVIYAGLGYDNNCMTKRALRDGNFAEIYHPVTGEIYGGVQERWDKGITSWNSELKQTWSATGYIRMVLFDIIGLEIDEKGFNVKPNLIAGIETIELKNLVFRNKSYNISINNGRVSVEKEI